jgi:hypothetical protein
VQLGRLSFPRTYSCLCLFFRRRTHGRGIRSQQTRQCGRTREYRSSLSRVACRSIQYTDRYPNPFGPEVISGGAKFSLYLQIFAGDRQLYSVYWRCKPAEAISKKFVISGILNRCQKFFSKDLLLLMTPH